MSPRNILCAAGLLLLAGLATVRAEMQAGEQFPALDASVLAGNPVPATTGKVTLVDFWASWCAPCKASFPTYTQLHAQYAPHGLVIVGVSVDENPAKFAAFVRQLAPPFAIVRDAGHQFVARVKVAAMPTCFLLDRTGRVRFVHHGYHGAESGQELRREIESLLAEPPPST
jgi:thiol-disulfide isomerase/thioredoxin